MEHGSIAAFARLAMQLLALGAPPDLVARATRAMADETRHAKIAFSLASAHGGEPVGPGALRIDDALDGRDLDTVVRLAIREGCVGETGAALAVSEGASRCKRPELARVLATIASDELEHADLAWATVAWAARCAPARIGRVIQEEVDLLTRSACAEAAPEGDDLAEHGVIGDARFRALRDRAVRELVIPLLREMCRQLIQTRCEPPVTNRPASSQSATRLRNEGNAKSTVPSATSTS